MLTSLSFSLITDVCVFFLFCFNFFSPWTSTLSFFHASTSHLLIRLPGSNLSMTSWQTDAVKSRTIDPKGRGKSAKVKSPPDHSSFKDGFHQPTLTLTRRRERKKERWCLWCVLWFREGCVVGEKGGSGDPLCGFFWIRHDLCSSHLLLSCLVQNPRVSGQRIYSVVTQMVMLRFFFPILYLLKSNSAIVLFRCRDRDCSFVGGNMIKSKRY